MTELKPLTIEVTEVGSAVPPGSVVRNLGPDPLHLGTTCGDPQLLTGHEAPALGGALVTATGQRTRVEVRPPRQDRAAPEADLEPAQARQEPVAHANVATRGGGHTRSPKGRSKGKPGRRIGR